MLSKGVLLSGLVSILLATSAQADTRFRSDDPLDVGDINRWLFRVRAIDVLPDEDSTTTIGGEIDVDYAVVPEVDVSYFFTPNIAAELIAATTLHDVGAKNTALGNIDLGDVWVLPPTLTLQYHFNPEGQFRPYVGAGINYMYFYHEDSGDVDSISYDSGFAPAAQIGMDIGIDEHWALNADVKKIWYNVDAKVNGGAVRADVDLDPWVIGVGVAYRF